jgi:hypothetical protein
MADAKNTGSYRQGGEVNDPGWDTVGDNPTGRPRKSSARQRRKKDRRLFGGTPWSRKEQD